jgi:hypothetical protein
MIDTCSSVSRRTANQKTGKLENRRLSCQTYSRSSSHSTLDVSIQVIKKTGQKSHATVPLNPRYSLLRVTTEISNFENAKEE